VSVIVCCVAMQMEMRTEIRAERHRARIGQVRTAEPVRIEVMTDARSAACCGSLAIAMSRGTQFVEHCREIKQVMEAKTYNNANKIQFF